ncbi:hypothetical protein FRACYDRAFT_244146 [Fragilariopsis cylindrus CCMP1102]|uniref:Uncharacterized protein n=1 Tax=Fragilariopsis cylindrus CCMP1102 TaxID=635003 RepID=A0A1E7F4U1_9STRA|nr:hypothetical protein FRACYDRAFT_244146 [Fragilariopsis cylindrus CCMP1102]|eukprot:OEU12873.1 hypothetical protein FRACYDRAFT_244146 [Fragilariopsis cylindrus CCMP1102]
MGDQFKDGRAGEYASCGATSTSVLYVANTVQGYEYRLNDGENLEIAIRFLGSDNNLYFQQNSTELGTGSADIMGGGFDNIGNYYRKAGQSSSQFDGCAATNSTTTISDL